MLAVGTIDLLVEEEVGREPPGRVGKHPPRSVADEKPADGRRPVDIPHADLHRAGGTAVEEHGHLVAEPDVLRALPHAEPEGRLAAAGIATEELEDPIFQRKPGERRHHRLPVHHGGVEKPLHELVGGDRGG